MSQFQFGNPPLLKLRRHLAGTDDVNWRARGNGIAQLYNCSSQLRIRIRPADSQRPHDFRHKLAVIPVNQHVRLFTTNSDRNLTLNVMV